MNIIGYLPTSEGYPYTVTDVNTVTGLLALYPACHPDQPAVLHALECLCAVYSLQLVIESDNSMHFTSTHVKQWAKDMGTVEIPHPLPSQAAEIIE